MIDIDGLISEAEMKKIALNKEMPPYTPLFLPFKNNTVYDTAVQTSTKPFEEIYQKYDEFTIGEILCEMVLKLFGFKGGEKNVETIYTKSSIKKPKTKTLLFFQLAMRNGRTTWIKNYDKCLNLKGQGKIAMLTDSEVQTVQTVLTGLLEQTAAKRMSLTAAQQS